MARRDAPERRMLLRVLANLPALVNLEVTETVLFFSEK